MKSGNFAPFGRRALGTALASAVLLGGAGLSVGAHAVTGTSTASATVVTPISFTNPTTLAFGKFTKAAGTVTITPAGNRSATGANALLITNSTHAAGQLDVLGEANATYSITLTGGNLSDGASPANTMALGSLTAAASTATGTTITTGTLSGSGTQSLKIGGALTVGATQVSGTYTGTYSVALEYN